MSRPKSRIEVHGSSTPLTQGLSGLSALRDQLPPGPPTAAATSSAPADAKSARATTETVYTRASKLVLRRERKGHGGKTATRIEGLKGNAKELEAAVSELKRGLGCGAVIDGDCVFVQGDQTERVAAFLQARGARKVVIGT